MIAQKNDDDRLKNEWRVEVAIADRYEKHQTWPIGSARRINKYMDFSPLTKCRIMDDSTI